MPANKSTKAEPATITEYAERLTEPRHGKDPLVDYADVDAALRNAPGTWGRVGDEFPYEQAITVARALRRRGLEAHIRGEGRRTNGPAQVWARYMHDDKF